MTEINGFEGCGIFIPSHSKTFIIKPLSFFKSSLKPLPLLPKLTTMFIISEEQWLHKY